jgi:hypothetical protein
MLASLRPSQNIAILATLAPASQAAGTYTTGWIAAAQFEAFLAVVQNGVLGASATIDAKMQQAQDSGGTGAKDITVTAMTQNVKATDDGKVNLINLLQRDLDLSNGFGYLRLSITVGTAASLVGGLILGVNERYAPAASNNASAVKQVVN